MKKVTIEAPAKLQEILQILEEEFDLTPTELLRVGLLDPMKLYPIPREEPCSAFDLLLPYSLHARLEVVAGQVKSTFDVLVGHLLWEMVLGFKKYPCPVRKNEEGRRRLETAISSLGLNFSF